METRPSHSACCLALIVLCLLAPVSGGSSTGKLSADMEAQMAPDPPDPVETGQFFDEVVPVQLSSFNIPGAVVIVVRDGAVIFSKGYGYSDTGNGEPISPDRTVFRIGSVSKLFIWTAVLQLEEEEKVDLDEDVNQYLKGVLIPDTYPCNPVTLRHLFSHTAGFEERSIGLLAGDESGLIPSEQFLSENMPKRVYPPGLVSSYSNYGAALAGKVVGDVSGIPFEDYAEEQIFQPLGMDNSSFRQPLPPEMTEMLAVGYSCTGGMPVEGNFEFFQLAPSGAMSSTGTDMGAFMIMLLQNGRYENRTILEHESAQKMKERLFSHDPRIPGWTYGFMERESYDWRVLWHGGDTLYFHSAIVIVPELDTGIFVSFNGGSGSGAGISLADQFLGRFYPRALSSCNGSLPATGDLEGVYISTRSAKSTIEKILILSGSEEYVITAARNPEGVFTLDGVPFRRSEDLFFCSPGSGMKAVFRPDTEGKAAWLFLGNHPQSAYEKIPFEGSPFFQKILFIAFEGVFLAILLLWSGSILFGLEKTALYLPRREFGPLHLLFTMICGTNVLFTLLLFSQIGGAGLLFGIPHLTRIILLVPLLSAGIFIGAFILTALQLFDNRYTRRDRIEFVAISITALLFLLWLSFWKLLGWNF